MMVDAASQRRSETGRNVDPLSAMFDAARTVSDGRCCEPVGMVDAASERGRSWATGRRSAWSMLRDEMAHALDHAKSQRRSGMVDAAKARSGG